MGLEKCKLSVADKRKMGPAPEGMVKPHRLHIGREKAPKSWSAKNRKLITDVQYVLKKYGIDINTDPRNFTWAQNGGGAHTIKAARHVWNKVMAAAPHGKSAVEETLSKLGREMSRGIFF
ncbi:hypothetical protein V2I52_23285 [Brenneria sp. g21c3]|uniref:hypothetical protein n=1 Tax=Brenneria sp. g21c3 TaxID=3093893 RepID=UPI002EAE6F26|nr:hypothetical protein [Brenneria sp. g21c3]